MMPCLEAEYAPCLAEPLRPAMEEMLTIRPQPRSRMGRTAARHIRKVPVRFTSSTCCHASSGTFSMSLNSRDCGAAALFTRMSSRPKVSSANSTIRLASSSRLTSPSTEAQRTPAPVSSPTKPGSPSQLSAMSPGCWFRFGAPLGATSHTTTALPSPPRARAIAAPMPRCFPHPVISATRSWELSVITAPDVRENVIWNDTRQRTKVHSKCDAKDNEMCQVTGRFW